MLQKPDTVACHAEESPREKWTLGLLDYFAPLQTWRKEQTGKNCGWGSSKTRDIKTPIPE